MYPSNSNKLSKIAARANQVNAAFGKVNSAHPGQNMGLTLEDVKSIVDNAQKIVGTTFVAAAGTTTPNVQLPSTAKYMVGIIFGGTPAATDSFSMMINNERTIDNASVLSYQATTGKPQIGFFPFERPIAGSTSINLSYQSVAGGTPVIFQVVYI